MQPPLLASWLLLTAPLASAQVTNIAPLGTASQVSTWSSATVAQNAVDGNRDGAWVHGSIQATLWAPNAWWQVELHEPSEVTEIHLYNRSDCCAQRLSNFRVSAWLAGLEVWGEDVHVGTGFIPLGGMEAYLPPTGTFADAVRVQLLGLSNNGEAYLNFAECEVHAPSLGSNVCGPANANSSGLDATLQGLGSLQVAAADFHLIAHRLPPGQFGYFLASRGSALGSPPGSQGTLCLAGPIARFNAQVLSTPAAGGYFSTALDLTAIPLSPAVAVQPGETWYFQAWFRDLNPGPTSNFTDALEVSFR